MRITKNYILFLLKKMIWVRFKSGNPNVFKLMALDPLILKCFGNLTFPLICSSNLLKHISAMQKKASGGQRRPQRHPEMRNPRKLFVFEGSILLVVLPPGLEPGTLRL
jgi:hypothetical protein